MKIRNVVKKNLQPIIFVIVTFSLMVSISYFSFQGMLQRQLQYNAKREMDNLEANARLMLSESEARLRNVVVTITDIVENGGGNEDILKFFIAATGSMKGGKGRVAGFNSLYGYINGEYLDGTLWDPLDPVDGFRDKDGNILPYIPQERIWYISAMEAREDAIALTQPYNEAMSGTFVVSVSAKVEVSEKFIGVVSMDIDITSLKEYVRGIKFSEGGYGTMLNNEFTIMTHRDRHLINLNMRDAGGEYAYIAERLAAGENLFNTKMTDVDGTNIMVFFNKFNNGYIGVITPVKSYNRDLTHMAVTLAFLGLIFSAALIFLLLKFSVAQMLSDARDRSKSTFLATMSHEIRTPMNAIIGIAQTQLQRGNLPKEHEEGFGRIYNSAHSLLRIINDILDLSKIETGKLELNDAEYDTPSLINDAAQIHALRAGEKGIDFTVDVNNGLPAKLCGDELRIKQVLHNLLSNAVKYTDKGYVKLSIVHSPAGEDVMLKISVEDSGQGIGPEDRAKLFSEYNRFNAAANQDTEGTGLGLSITRRLVEMMGGKIEVKSEYGKGSLFTVEITQKRVPCEAIGTEISERLKKFTFAEDKKNWQWKIDGIMPYGKILIVDDAETNLFVAKGLLALWKLNIETARSGFAAIDLVNAGKVYDVIFLDHMMPKMDGIETARRIRGLGYENALVALTANALAGNEEKFKACGFDEFISKPIEVRRLASILDKFVRDRHPEEAEKYKSPVDAGENVEAANPMNGAWPGARAASAVDPQMLMAFRRDAEKAISALRKTAQNGDMKFYATTVHAMKSALANVGENEKSQLAAALEKAGINGDRDYIRANTEQFVNSLEELMQALPDSMETASGNDENISEDADFLVEQLQAVATACENYDNLAARRAFGRLDEKRWKKATAKTLEDINTAIFQHSEFEEAAERIRKFLDAPRA